MFSGQYLFQDILNDFLVFLAITQSIRPSRPHNQVSQGHDLNDEIWHLIEACWAQDQTQRPTATEVVKRLQALPGCLVDQRPLDNWVTVLPSQALPKEFTHALSTLAPSVNGGSVGPTTPSKLSNLSQCSDEPYIK